MSTQDGTYDFEAQAQAICDAVPRMQDSEARLRERVVAGLREAHVAGNMLRLATTREFDADAKRVRQNLSSDICKARNEYDDERDGDFDDYMAGHVLAALDFATIQTNAQAGEAGIIGRHWIEPSAAAKTRPRSVVTSGPDPGAAVPVETKEPTR